jgi:ubiquitin C-terminal hydrolase
VQDCLAHTTFTCEDLSGKNAYYCECCKTQRVATKQLSMQSYPAVLPVVLKRFRTTGGCKGGDKAAEAEGFEMQAGCKDSSKSPASTYQASKVCTRVSLNAGEVLDLTPFCSPAGLQAAAAAGKSPPRYELIAVADHRGSLGGGHYTARGRCLADGSWVECNDSLVLPIDAPSGSSGDAYMLLYRLIHP